MESIRLKYHSVRQSLNSMENQIVSKRAARWGTTAGLAGFFILRIIVTGKYISIMYFVYIYMLSAFLMFITPKNKEELATLPVSKQESGEYKQYQRQLPEFSLWQRITVANFIGLTLSLFRMFDLPVYAPILIIYCVLLTVVFLKQEFDRWKDAAVDAKQAVKYWIGMAKPRFEK